jgi:hypothetical protein
MRIMATSRTVAVSPRPGRRMGNPARSQGHPPAELHGPHLPQSPTRRPPGETKILAFIVTAASPGYRPPPATGDHEEAAGWT